MAMRAKENEATLAEALRAALAELRMAQDDFWARYRIAGGKVKLAAFKNYLRGISEPQVHDYDLMAMVMNQELGEERFPRVPFKARGGDNGLESASPDSPTGRSSSLGADSIAA